MIPKQVDVTWKLAKSNTVLDIDALFVLRDDLPNYSSTHAPFIVESAGEFFGHQSSYGSKAGKLSNICCVTRRPVLERQL